MTASSLSVQSTMANNTETLEVEGRTNLPLRLSSDNHQLTTSYVSVLSHTIASMCAQREVGKREGGVDKETTSNGIMLAPPTGGPGLGHKLKTKKKNKNKRGNYI